VAADTLQSLWRGFARWSEAPAIIAFSGEAMETISFATLVARSERVAGALAKRDIGPGRCVGIIAPNSPAWIIAYWGIIAAGATALPMDALLSDADAAHLLENAGCRTVFTTSARAAKLPSGCDAILLDGADLPGEPAASLPNVAAADVAVILFTSGTTGTPKAVPLSHANLLSNVEALVATKMVSETDRALLPLPLHHAYPQTVGMSTALACGAAIILPAGISGPELVAALQRGRASVLVGVPRLYSALVTNITARVASSGRTRLFGAMLSLSNALRRTLHLRLGRKLFASLHRQMAPGLRLLVSGGAALDREVERTLNGLGWEVMTGYGLTETSPILAFNRPGASRAGSAGRPLPGVDLRIVNPDADAVGEIQAKGASVFSGYRDDPAATARAFTEDHWFRTGDFGRLDGDGYLNIIARVAETIVLADGKKLFPETIETVYAANPLIEEIALMAIDGALVALVRPDFDKVRAAGTVRLEDLIRETLTARARELPSHARLTGFAIAREKLPRTQLGKLRRHLLPALYAKAKEAHGAAGPVELTPEDQKLLAEPVAASLWRFLHARFPDRVLDLDMSPQLDLGIDSLGWVDLTIALERDLGVSLTEREIARILSLRDFVHEAIAAPKASARPAAAPAPAFRPLGPGLSLLRLLFEGILRLAMRFGFALRVEGVERLPAAGPFLLCPNHASFLDPLALAAALPHARLRKTLWLGWAGILMTTRVRRLLSRIAQIVPIDPDQGAQASLALSAAALARGDTLVWFPEGALSPDGKLRRFLPGIGLLLERQPATVVPVYIAGTFAAWPSSRRWPRRSPVTVRFGTPFQPVRAGHQEMADAVRAAVIALGAEAGR
jgi:long-chain acyl-CoA synthetase